MAGETSGDLYRDAGTQAKMAFDEVLERIASSAEFGAGGIPYVGKHRAEDREPREPDL